MKVVILAGGMGTRISEESQYKPKPMIEIGGKPIIWHIMKYYSSYGFNEFIICCGYKGDMIKKYFLEYNFRVSNVKFDLKSDNHQLLSNTVESWKVTLVNTGLKTLTSGRLLKIEEYIDGDEFLFTYGDGVSNVDLDKLIKFHKSNGRIATITVTKPEGRFGTVKIDKHTKEILSFKEKVREDQSLVNIGYGVFSKKIFKYLGDGSDMLEGLPFDNLVKDNQMNAYEHNGFWSPMDNMKDKKFLEKIWETKSIPWKRW